MNRLLRKLQLLGYVDSSNSEVISFGLKRIRDFIIDIAGALLCAAIMGNLFVGVLFEFTYVPLRVYAGGYHASSEKKCTLLSWGSAICCLLIVFYLSIPAWFLHILMAFSAICIIVLSPVESAKKPLSSNEKNIFRKRSLMILFFEIAFYCLFILSGMEMYAKTMCIAIVLIVSGLIAGHYSEKSV